MEKTVWACKIIACWPHRWLILIMFYLVVHHHWINPQNILLKIHLSFYFRMHIYLFFFWCCHIVWCKSILCAFASFSVSLNLIWQVPFHFKYSEWGWRRSGSLNSLRWNIWTVQSNGSSYQQCMFHQDNQKIENGSKKTFTIIPKSTKFANVSSVNDSQYTVVCHKFIDIQSL